MVGGVKISKLSDLAKDRLDPEDQVQRTYRGRWDGTGGVLLLSNRRLLFVHEEGVLRKTYTLVMDIPYEKVGKFAIEGRYQLAITDVGGRKHIFTSALRSSIIEKSLKDLIESARE